MLSTCGHAENGVHVGSKFEAQSVLYLESCGLEVSREQAGDLSSCQAVKSATRCGTWADIDLGPYRHSVHH